MSRKTKYLKFGARADLNLADLDNKTAALDNILNNLSTQLDADGNNLQFTSADLLPLVGISQTGLTQYLTETGQSSTLVQLAGNTVQTTTEESTLVDVEPRITIQDYIDNYKAVLGNPPWIDGGTGPNATFIPSDRLNSNTTDTLDSEIVGTAITAGNRYKIEVTGGITEAEMNAISVTNKGSAPAVGDIFVASASSPSGGNYGLMTVRNITIPRGDSGTSNANALRANQLFTTKVDSSLESTIGPVDFWTDGKFVLSGKLHPDFKDTFGGIQWEGYLTNRFDPQFFTDGYFIIEEDLNDDNNWTFIKGVTSSEVKTFGTVTYLTNDAGVTQIEFSDQDDYKRVCIGMTISLNNTVGTVEDVKKAYDSSANVDRYYAFLDVDVGNADSSGAIRTFEYDNTAGQIRTEILSITRTPLGLRRKIRFSAYWPALSGGQQYPQKTFEEDHDGSRRMSFELFYKGDGVSDSFGKYSFPYFNANRAHVLKQDSTAKLTVADLVSLEYKPEQRTYNLYSYYNEGTNAVTHKSVKLTDIAGTLESENIGVFAFSKVDKGDWIIVVPSFTTNWANAGSKAYAFQILEKVDNNKVYVSNDYATATGFTALQNHNIITVKNNGIVGIYKFTHTSFGEQVSLEKLDTVSGSMNRDVSLVARDDLVTGVGFNGTGTTSNAQGDNTARAMKTTVNGSAITLDIAAHPKTDNANGLFPGTAPGISVIYSSKGLNDLSAAAECEGVYGLEVSTNTGVSATRIYVTDTSRGSEMENDIVYFVGSDPSNPVIDQSSNGTVTGSTHIDAVNQAGGYIDISTSTNGPIPAGTTLVVVPDGYTLGKYLNREYCVVPLNTAPPFGSTNTGLETPAGYPNLMVKELVFGEIAISPPTANVVSLEGKTFADTTPDKVVSIDSPTATYKMLINDSTLS